MNITVENNRWTFPEEIRFESVSQYSQFFEQLENRKNLVFDLSHTEGIHSSFIGFLIYAKHTLQKEGTSLTLLLSSTSERILAMLNILNYFAPEIQRALTRKTA